MADVQWILDKIANNVESLPDVKVTVGGDYREVVNRDSHEEDLALAAIGYMSNMLRNEVGEEEGNGMLRILFDKFRYDGERYLT